MTAHLSPCGPVTYLEVKLPKKAGDDKKTQLQWTALTNVRGYNQQLQKSNQNDYQSNKMTGKHLHKINQTGIARTKGPHKIKYDLVKRWIEQD